MGNRGTYPKHKQCLICKFEKNLHEKIEVAYWLFFPCRKKQENAQGM